jgi:NAD-reducing hydrogenase large subunit
VRSPLSEEGRAWIFERLPESLATTRTGLDIFKKLINGPMKEEVQVFGQLSLLFMSLVGKGGAWEHYDGHLRFTDGEGNIVQDHLSEDDYADFVGEAVEDWSYLKFPYYKARGYPDGLYRVGPLARLNNCSHIGTPAADAELQEFRNLRGGSHIVLPLSLRPSDRDSGFSGKNSRIHGRSRPDVRSLSSRCRGE